MWSCPLTGLPCMLTGLVLALKVVLKVDTGAHKVAQSKERLHFCCVFTRCIFLMYRCFLWTRRFVRSSCTIRLSCALRNKNGVNAPKCHALNSQSQTRTLPESAFEKLLWNLSSDLLTVHLTPKVWVATQLLRPGSADATLIMSHITNSNRTALHYTPTSTAH